MWEQRLRIHYNCVVGIEIPDLISLPAPEAVSYTHLDVYKRQVGALSIVRFRTAIKEPLDIVFLFWSIAVGIVLAAGMIPLAMIGSVFIGLMLLVFVNRKSHWNPYIVILRCSSAEGERTARTFLEHQVRRCVVKSKTVRLGEVELTMEVRLLDEDTEFINQLSQMDGVDSAVLVSYNGDYMG